MSGGTGAGGGGNPAGHYGPYGGVHGNVPGTTAFGQSPASSPAGGYSPPPMSLRRVYSQPAPVAAPSETAATAATDPVKKDPLFDNAAIEAAEKRNLRQRRRPLLATSDDNSSTLGSSGTIFRRKDHGTTF